MNSIRYYSYKMLGWLILVQITDGADKISKYLSNEGYGAEQFTPYCTV